MASIWNSLRKRFTRVQTLPAGIFRYQTPPDAPTQYRLHLRLERDGTGVLIVNAATVLHLNQTAAEYALQWVHNVSPEAAAQAISSRYRVSRKRALADYEEFLGRMERLSKTTDLDPESYLGFDRQDPYVLETSAPYRLDCALTYRLPEGDKGHYAPVERVTAELTTADWTAIMEKAWQAGIPHVVFTGGEPTLRDDLPALIAAGERIGQVTGILSGSEQLASADYLKSLLDSGLDHLMFLIHPDREKSWKTLENLMAADLFVTAHITLNRENAARAGGMLDRLNSLSVRSLSLSASDSSGADALVAMRNLAANCGIPVQWDLPVPYSPANPVAEETGAPSKGAGKAWLYVEPDGDVLPEQGVNKVLGNFLRDPWDDIWTKARS